MDVNNIRVGVVGLGHRGRFMFKLAADSFDFVVPAAACDIKPVNWYEKQCLCKGTQKEYQCTDGYTCCCKS